MLDKLATLPADLGQPETQGRRMKWAGGILTV
jgi:hypothetical protein